MPEMRAPCLAALLLLCGAAPAQELERRQQSESFDLQLRQSQQELGVPPGDLQRRQEMESLHLQQRQRLDNLSGERDPSKREMERQNSAREREQLDLRNAPQPPYRQTRPLPMQD